MAFSRFMFEYMDILLFIYCPGFCPHPLVDQIHSGVDIGIGIIKFEVKLLRKILALQAEDIHSKNYSIMDTI
jgi:hypothetical protein